MIRVTRVPLVALTAATLLCSSLALADTEISGRYIGNDQGGKLAYGVVLSRDAWDGEPAWTVVLSEKDPAESGNPEGAAIFNELGHALVIQVTESGTIFGTQVCHQALEKSGFSTSGTLQVENFTIESGQLDGRFFTDGEQTFFGDTWEVDLKVSVSLPVE